MAAPTFSGNVESIIMNKGKKRNALVVAGAVVVGGASNALAVAQDWSAIGTTVDTEIAGVLPVALPIFGLILALGIAIGLFRKIAR